MFPLKDTIASRKFPFVNSLFIAVNAAVFFLELSLQGSGGLETFIKEYAFIPASFLQDVPGEWHTVFTSMFLHGGWMHFLGNMLFLYIFGDNVEDRLGHVLYIVFYLAGGACGSLLQLLTGPGSTVPMIGASGCISAVLGAYVVFYPKAGVLTFLFLGIFSRIVVIPAYFFLGFWFVMQVFSGGASFAMEAATGKQAGGVAYFAHIGGFVAGLTVGALGKAFGPAYRYRFR